MSRPNYLVATLFGLTLLAGVIWAYIAFRHETRVAVTQDGQIVVNKSYADTWREKLPELLRIAGMEFDTANGKIDGLVDEAVESAFAPVSDAIPAYIDFHYSVIGQYSELHAAAFKKNAASHMQKILFEDTDFDTRLTANMTDAATQGDAILKEALDHVRASLEAELDLSAMELDSLQGAVTLSLEDAQDRFVKSGAATLTAGAAVLVVRTISTKLAARAAVKAAGTAAVETGSVAAGATGGAAAGLVCGPGAPICSTVLAVAGGAAVWLATDKVMNEVDKHFNADAFEAEIRAALEAQKADVKAQAKAAHARLIDQIRDANRSRLEGATVVDMIRYQDALRPHVEAPVS